MAVIVGHDYCAPSNVGGQDHEQYDGMLKETDSLLQQSARSPEDIQIFTWLEISPAS